MLTQFHYDVARAELDFAMQYLRDYRAYAGTGARGDEPNATYQTYTLERSVQALAEWLDAYAAGTATLEGWQAAVSASIDNGFVVRDVVWQRIELERATP